MIIGLSENKYSALQHFYPSEGKIEQFLRGEGPLEFRSAFDIDDSKAEIVERAADGSDLKEGETPVQFLAIKGTATTSNVDDNGVDVVPSALKSLPADFQRRKTVLFNHNYDWPIGKLTDESTSYVPGKTELDYSRVTVDPVLIDLESRALDGVRFADKIERGILRTFSIGWSTKDGIVVFDRGTESAATQSELMDLGYEEDDENVMFSFRIGVESAPKVRVLSMTGIELSIVSAPADADSDFSTANFGRSLSRALHSFKNSKNSRIVVPQAFVSTPELYSPDGPKFMIEPDGLSTLPSRNGDGEEDEVEVTEIYAIEATTPSRAPWNEKNALIRILDHFSPDTIKDVDWGRFCACGDGDDSYYFMHHDVRDEEIVSNEIAVLSAIRELFDGSIEWKDIFDEAVRHLTCELMDVHGYAEEDLPESLLDYFENKEVLNEQNDGHA